MAIAEWLEENVDSHGNVYISKLKELSQFGIDVSVNGSQCVVKHDDKIITIHGSSWEDTFESHKAQDYMGFTVIRPEKETDEIEARYCEDDTMLPKDEKGEYVNDREEQAYVVVKYPEQSLPFGGWIWDTPEARKGFTAVGHYVVAELAWLLTDTHPGASYGGRGSAYRACIRAIVEWEEKNEKQ